MEQNNIYAAPETTEVVNHSAETHTPLTLKQKLWGFKGRISRAGYWGYTYSAVLLASIPAMIAYGIGAALLMTPEVLSDGAMEEIPVAGITSFAVAFLLYIPAMWMSYAIIAKRFHDRGKSGWWSLISFVPYVGGIWILIDCGCLAGDKGKNHYGDDPLLADGKTHATA